MEIFFGLNALSDWALRAFLMAFRSDWAESQNVTLEVLLVFGVNVLEGF